MSFCLKLKWILNKLTIPIIKNSFLVRVLVLQVEIKQSTLRPHYALAEDKTWWAYIRLKDKSVLANEIVIDVLKQENNDQEIYQKYVSKEKELLKYLQTNSRITTEEYSAILNLSHRRTRCILVSLVLSGIIELHATEKELFFTAS